jgi:hypothetical protein
MARWTDGTPQALADQLRERGDRWRALLDAPPDSAFAIPVQPWSIRGAKALGDVVGDWRGHHRQHAEDVRLALANGLTRASGQSRLGRNMGVKPNGLDIT